MKLCVDLARPGSPWKPSEFFAYAEAYATTVRKLLHKLKTKDDLWGNSASMDDAEAIAILIEQLARYGTTASAADAIEIAERVESLTDMLRAEIDAILAS
jgi:hypothetical protein